MQRLQHQREEEGDLKVQRINQRVYKQQLELDRPDKLLLSRGLTPTAFQNEEADHQSNLLLLQRPSTIKWMHQSSRFCVSGETARLNYITSKLSDGTFISSTVMISTACGESVGCWRNHLSSRRTRGLKSTSRRRI